MRIQTVFTLICSLFLFIQTLGTTHESLASSLAATIVLDKAVHFVALNGDDVVVPSGAYSIETKEGWLRLNSGEAREALLLQAKESTHDEKVVEPIALSIPSDQESDLFFQVDSRDTSCYGLLQGLRNTPQGQFDTTFQVVYEAQKTKIW